MEGKMSNTQSQKKTAWQKIKEEGKKMQEEETQKKREELATAMDNMPQGKDPFSWDELKKYLPSIWGGPGCHHPTVDEIKDTERGEEIFMSYHLSPNKKKARSMKELASLIRYSAKNEASCSSEDERIAREVMAREDRNHPKKPVHDNHAQIAA